MGTHEFSVTQNSNFIVKMMTLKPERLPHDTVLKPGMCDVQDSLCLPLQFISIETLMVGDRCLVKSQEPFIYSLRCVVGLGKVTVLVILLSYESNMKISSEPVIQNTDMLKMTPGYSLFPSQRHTQNICLCLKQLCLCSKTGADHVGFF